MGDGTLVLDDGGGGAWDLVAEQNGVFEESAGSVVWVTDGGNYYTLDVRCSSYALREGTKVVDEGCSVAPDVRECFISEADILFCNPNDGTQAEFERSE